MPEFCNRFLVLSQNTDLYYYTGSVQPLYAIIPAKGEPFVLARKAVQRIRDEIIGFHLEEFRNTTDLEQIIRRNGLTCVKRIAFAFSDSIAYSTVQRWQEILLRQQFAICHGKFGNYGWSNPRRKLPNFLKQGKYLVSCLK